MTPWVGFLILANAVVYLVINQTMPQLASLLQFRPMSVAALPWTPLTYMFVHAGFSHIFWNMLVLYFFGPRVETRLGGKRFIGLYFVSGLGGALLSFINPEIAIIGASGAVFGVELAFARYWPRDRIYIWGVLPVEAWLLVVIMTGVSIFGGLGRVGNTAHWAHLGGFAGAAVYLWLMERFSPARQFRQSAKPSPRGVGMIVDRGAVERWSQIRGEDLHEVNRAELDRIRSVIADRGPSALTPDDRAFLDRFSAR
ncbi:MAG: rhomboid family intramembrane serine protease [Gemmatimonadota bacterium]